jgi:hypothetical protein
LTRRALGERIAWKKDRVERVLRMADPRLCSIHLEAQPRRQEYRRAREALLSSCGERTLALDPQQLEEMNKTAGAGPPLRFWLVDRNAVFPLKAGVNTIGRLSDNDVAVLDGGVSRRHAAIVIHVNSACELHDTASKNGTYLNGQRIGGPTPLKAGDEIRLCDRQMTLVLDASEPPPLANAADSPTMITS